MNTQYDYDYFLQKFSAIPDEQWCENVLSDRHGRFCALGHCGAAGSSVFIKDRYGPISDDYPEAQALRKLVGLPIGPINNGEFERYQQPTPRARILAALADAKAHAEAALDAYETRELKPISVVPPDNGTATDATQLGLCASVALEEA